jgi:hypothetical protein
LLVRLSVSLEAVMHTTTIRAGSGSDVRSHAETWQGERLVTYTCCLGSLADRLPRVERRPFTLAPAALSPDAGLGSTTAPTNADNPYYDMVVRLPDDTITTETPLGIVSKRYRLVQHGELLDGVVQGLKAAGLAWEPLETDVRITELGSRLHFTVHMPAQFRAPIEDDGLDLTIECLNSVDRSRAFRVGMGWIRLVCGNGLFIGRLKATMRRPHVPALHVERVPGLVAAGFKAAEADAAVWRTRSQMTVATEVLETWADHVVTKARGMLAAARTLHIARTGYDGRFSDLMEKAPASRRAMTHTAAVPGSRPPNEDVFRVGQILAWLANSPGEWGARLERRRQVPELLAPLMRAATGRTVATGRVA